MELGGSCLNTIRVLSQLGNKTSFTGMVAEDEYGKLVKERLEAQDIRLNLGLSR